MGNLQGKTIFQNEFTVHLTAFYQCPILFYIMVVDITIHTVKQSCSQPWLLQFSIIFSHKPQTRSLITVSKFLYLFYIWIYNILQHGNVHIFYIWIAMSLIFWICSSSFHTSICLSLYCNSGCPSKQLLWYSQKWSSKAQLATLKYLANFIVSKMKFNYSTSLPYSIQNWIFNIKRTHRHSPVRNVGTLSFVTISSCKKKERKKREGKRRVLLRELAFFSLLPAETLLPL